MTTIIVVIFLTTANQRRDSRSVSRLVSNLEMKDNNTSDIVMVSYSALNKDEWNSANKVFHNR